MSNVVSALLAWILLHAAYEGPVEPPEVAYQPQAFFDEHACPGTDVQCSVRGLYRDGSGIIVMHESYRHLDDLRSRALMVHELVHFLQDQSGRWGDKTCASWLAREQEAYRLQHLYLVMHGGWPARYRRPLLSRASCPG